MEVQSRVSVLQTFNSGSVDGKRAKGRRKRRYTDDAEDRTKKTVQNAYGLTEQGLTSHQTHYRSYRGRVFYGSNDPTNSVKASKH